MNFIIDVARKTPLANNRGAPTLVKLFKSVYLMIQILNKYLKTGYGNIATINSTHSYAGLISDRSLMKCLKFQ